MNRRQRRAGAGAGASSSSKNLKSAEDIPLTQPDRTKGAGKAKTLYEVAAERQAALMPHAKAFDASLAFSNVVNVKIGRNGEIIREGEGEAHGVDTTDLTETEVVPPILDTLFLAASLTALHFTLEVLTVHQYAQELLFTPIVQHAVLVAFPTLFLLIHLFRGHLLPISATALPPRVLTTILLLRQLSFVLIANLSGCYLIHLTNDKGYYAVMKNAPSVGTVWVWAVLELGLVGALAGVMGPGAYAWYWGYSII